MQYLLYTQVKMEDAPTLLKIPKSECPDVWIRLPKHNWPKSWSSMEDPVVPLERNLYGHRLEGLIVGKAIRERSIEKQGWEQGSKLGMPVRKPSKRVILMCVCGRFEISWKETEHYSDLEDTHERPWFG